MKDFTPFIFIGVLFFLCTLRGETQPVYKLCLMYLILAKWLSIYLANHLPIHHLSELCIGVVPEGWPAKEVICGWYYVFIFFPGSSKTMNMWVGLQLSKGHLIDTRRLHMTLI